jgi:hypothetical protein
MLLLWNRNNLGQKISEPNRVLNFEEVLLSTEQLGSVQKGLDVFGSNLFSFLGI